MIRPAVPADARELARIDALVGVSPRRAEQFTAAREQVLVVENSGRVCGFALFSQVLDEATLIHLAIDPADQGQGLGRQLLAATLAAMAANNAARCLLELRASNAAARALYQRAGFTVDGLRRNYYPADGGREDALLMSMLL